MPRLFLRGFKGKRFLLSLMLACPAGAQEADEIPLILHSGSGKVEEERQIHFSGGSDSDVVKNHRRGTQKPATLIHQPPAIQASRRIYRCQFQGREVYADEENRVKYSRCVKISDVGSAAPAMPAPEALPRVPAAEGCSGAIVYRGNTYIFNEQEPCPIPASVFQQRPPLEALPAYYQNPTGQASWNSTNVPN